MSLTTNFAGSPYYDDFDATKKYLRLLFKPSYAVQARELTQIQSLLQNQVKSFGEHIFKNGSIHKAKYCYIHEIPLGGSADAKQNEAIPVNGRTNRGTTARGTGGQDRNERR